MPQTITVQVTAPATATYDTAFTVSANASSGLTVSFSAGGACTSSGSRFQMTSGTGTCTVRFDQAGDATYAAAPQVVETVTATKADQDIAQFVQPPKATYGDPNFSLQAITTSGLPVTFSATGKCTVSAVSVHLTGAGSCTVTASQPGDANYDAAPPVSRTFAIAKKPQFVTLSFIPDKVLGNRDFTVRATADSKLRVLFSAKGACTVKGSRVHLLRVGNCTITAYQPGNANFKRALSDRQTFRIARRR